MDCNNIRDKHRKFVGVELTPMICYIIAHDYYRIKLVYSTAAEKLEQKMIALELVSYGIELNNKDKEMRIANVNMDLLWSLKAKIYFDLRQYDKMLHALYILIHIKLTQPSRLVSYQTQIRLMLNDFHMQEYLKSIACTDRYTSILSFLSF